MKFRGRRPPRKCPSVDGGSELRRKLPYVFPPNRSVLGPFHDRVGIMALHVRKGRLAMIFFNLDIYPALSLFFLPRKLSSSSSFSSNSSPHPSSSQTPQKCQAFSHFRTFPNSCLAEVVTQSMPRVQSQSRSMATRLLSVPTLRC